METIFYTMKEVIELTRLSDMTIRRIMAKGEIPSYKLGKKRLFKKSDIDKSLREVFTSQLMTGGKR